ncbi:MAG: dienelactone hydrolase family protein [Polyangiaceae bacterium]|nr:dienelactone hydrolase family protein [Polyangiaceae bacterium]
MWFRRFGAASVCVLSVAACDPGPQTVSGSTSATPTVETRSDVGPLAALAGSGAALPPATVDVGPAKVDFIHHYTGGAKSGDAVPLVIAIHGLGDNPSSFVKLFDGFSGKAHFIVPAGGLPWSDGYAWWPITGQIDEMNMAAGVEAATHRLSTALREWQAGPIAGKPIVTGFSQGGMLSFALAAKHPDQIGEAFPVAGLLPTPLVPAAWPAGMSKPRVFAFHGDSDSRVPFALGKRSVENLKNLGLEVELKSYARVAHAITPEVRRDLFTELEAAISRASK